MVAKQERTVVGSGLVFQGAQPADLPQREPGSRSDITDIFHASEKLWSSLRTSWTHKLHWSEDDKEVRTKSGHLYCTTRNKKGYPSAPI